MTLVLPLFILAAGIAVIVNQIMAMSDPSHPSLRFAVASSWNRRLFTLAAGGMIALFGLLLLVLAQLDKS